MLIKSLRGDGTNKHCQHGDFEAVVEYDNQKIAICSGGDILKNVKDNIERYKTNDYVIAASRNFDSFDRVIGVYNPIIVEKNFGDSVDFVNYAKNVILHIE